MIHNQSHPVRRKPRRRYRSKRSFAYQSTKSIQVEKLHPAVVLRFVVSIFFTVIFKRFYLFFIAVVIVCFRVAHNQPISVEFPAYSASHWLIDATFVSPVFGVIPLKRKGLILHKETYITVKAPPKELKEGEQFQIHVNTVSSNKDAVQVCYLSKCDNGNFEILK